MSPAAKETHTRVLIVDDHRMFADSLVRLLDDEADLEVVGLACTIDEAVRAAVRTRPDVVLLDFRLPDGDAPECLARLNGVAPNTQALIMTGLDDDATMRAARDSGCHVVTKNRGAGDLIAALRVVASGAAPPDDRGRARRSPRDATSTRLLSDRECDLLTELARGLSTAEIAETLHISPTTVRNHVQRILTKLGAHSRLEAVAIAIKKGIIAR